MTLVIGADRIARTPGQRRLEARRPFMLTLSAQYLRMEAAAQRGSGRTSSEVGSFGFRPAFQDTLTGQTYASTYTDGRPAPFHLLDGLPEDVVIGRDRSGRIARVVGTIVAGFVRDGLFYTRAQAAATLTAEASVAA
jgi:hypothetical protein